MERIKKSQAMETNSSFIRPDKKMRKKAVGIGLTLATSKALADAEKMCVPIKQPEEGDWLDVFYEDGETVDAFCGNHCSKGNDILYIQPFT